MTTAEQKIAVLGGDCRQFYLAARLAGYGYSVSMYGFSTEKAGVCNVGTNLNITPDFPRELKAELAKYTFFILPLPMSGDNLRLNAPYANDGDGSGLRLTVLFDALPNGAEVFAGRVSAEMAAFAAEKGVRLTDYFLCEELQIRNAVPTAEGAVDIIMRELPVTVSGLDCAVTGYGRVGCVTARLLKAMGARVTVFARSARDRACAVNDGMAAYHIGGIAGNASFRVLINTVPSVIIAKRELECMRSDVLLVDLAASPGGINVADAKNCGRRVIWALSLPGKTSPQSAGEIIADTVHETIQRSHMKKGGVK